MPTLFSWNLEARGSEFFVRGVVSGHPRLREGERVHTSPIRRAAQEGDRVLIETMSGSTYQLLLKNLDESAGGPERPQPPGLPPDFWDRCVRARGQAAETEEEALRGLGAPGTLRLRTVGPTALSALWSGPDGRIRRIPIRAHLGTFQDSVLITDLFEDASGLQQVDFRYFPFWGRIEPYRVSAGIKAFLIVNEGLQSLSFGPRGQEVLCAAGETTRFAAQDNFNPTIFSQ